MNYTNEAAKNSGITLVALVVTIVVLLILSGITITTLFGDNGIINKAREAADSTNKATSDTEKGLENLIGQLGQALGEAIDITSDTVKTTAHNTIKVKDSLGNVFVLPKGFRVVPNGVNTTTYADPNNPTVQDGIVISDSNDENGNEFVWIPVGNVNIKKTNVDSTITTETVNIELARYDFTTDSSTIANSRIVKQSASNYAAETSFDPTDPYGDTSQVTEYATRDNPDGVAADDSTGKNAIAKDLKGFITSATINKGYYLARFEASKETRTEKNDANEDVTVNIPASKYNKTTWTGVTQINSALASRIMYKDNDTNIGVKSDLVNSYAWDTAIIYIEKMNAENNNYANTKQGGDEDKQSNKLATGLHNDKVCNIHDMSGNVWEWSTEYSTYSLGSVYYPCVGRGGCRGDSDSSAAFRRHLKATYSIVEHRFPPYTLDKVATYPCKQLHYTKCIVVI